MMDRKHTSGGFWKSRLGLALITFLAVGGLLLAFEHREHILTGDWSLALLLLVCGGMHLFMHGGHGGHGGGGGNDDEGGR